MPRKIRAKRPEGGAPAPVRVQRATRAGRAPSVARLALWAHAAGARAGRTLTVRLVGYPESRRLNAGFRGKVGATNVLAFPAGPAPAGAEAELGDLVICLPLVLREAREQGKKPLDHLAHLVVHGTLHLLGHDHDQEAKARKMENAEVRILRGLGIDNPYRCRERSPGRPRSP
jgi:probable rRNA maturation factor